MRIAALLLLLLFSLTINAQNPIQWSQTSEIASSQFGNRHPRIVVDGSGNPMVLWGRFYEKQAYFSRKTANGFSAPTLLNPPSIPVLAASWAGPDMAAHGDTVYVVFKETPEDVNNVYLVRSFDGGLNFSDPVRVDFIGDSIARFPTVATDALGNPLVAFMKFDSGWGSAHHVVAKSEDYGETFKADVPASGFSGGNVCDCCPATMAVSGNTAAILYRDNLNNLRNSWAGVSIDGGESFEAGVQIDDSDWVVSACPASGPDGTIVGENLYSVFMSAAGGKALCYRSKTSLTNMQLDFSQPLTGNFQGLGVQNFPRIASTGNAAAIVWTQTVNGSAQLAALFTDNVANGFPASYDVLAHNNVENADVAFGANGEVYVVWEDISSGTVKFKTGTYSLSGIQEKATSLFNLYPNPVSQAILNLEFDEAYNSTFQFQIYTAQGNLVAEGENPAVAGRGSIDITRLDRGIYFVRISHDGKTAVKPLVLE